MQGAESKPAPLWKLVDVAINLLAIAGGVLICLLAVLILIVVLSRHFGLFSITFTVDVIEYLIYLMTMFAAPWVLREGGHISVDLVVQALPRAKARRLLWSGSLSGAVICAILFYYSVKVAAASYSDGTLVHRSIVFDEWIILVPLPVTFLLLFLIFVRWLIWPHQARSGQSDGF